MKSVMKIFVSARPNAKETRVEKLGDGRFAISVGEPPVGGRANRAILKAVSEYFKVSAARVSIVSGRMSRNKVVEIL